jgi:hypothetical protein
MATRTPSFGCGAMLLWLRPTFQKNLSYPSTKSKESASLEQC